MRRRSGLPVGLAGWAALGLAFLLAWAGAAGIGAIVFLVSAILALAGVVVAIVGLVSRRPRSWLGLVVSGALLAFVVFLVWVVLEALSRLE